MSEKNVGSSLDDFLRAEGVYQRFKACAIEEVAAWRFARGIAASEFKVTFAREVDGRWIADIEALPGVMVFGQTRKQARTAVETLAKQVIADRIEHGEPV